VIVIVLVVSCFSFFSELPSFVFSFNLIILGIVVQVRGCGCELYILKGERESKGCDKD